MDDSLLQSEFSDGASSDFAPVKKTKAPVKKAAAPKSKSTTTKKTTQTTLKIPAKPTKPTKSAIPKKRSKDADSDEENVDAGFDSLNDDSLLSNTPPSAKKLKKAAPAPKKSAGKALQAMENGSSGKGKGAAADGDSSQRYQMLTPVQHILKRPDTYIGSIERTEQEMWAFNSETEMIEYRKVTFVPGLYKIFDEILVNAADNKQNDKNMNEIRVEINRDSGEISVYNNGKGIPIEMHKEKGIMIPEMIFGHLLTSSNYDDDQQKVTGGRNGYGAKLTNIYSVSFTVETANAKTKQKYKQTWTNNMSNMGKAKITSFSGEDYTKVTFTPDYARFGMTGMDDDFEALVKRRIYDMAGTCDKVKVKLNGDRIKVKDFKDYMKMYTKAIRLEQGGDQEVEKEVILIDKPHERWEVGFAVSDGSFKQVSFVNSIATTSGGSHVNYVADQIITKLIEYLKKTNKKGLQLKPNQIKNHLFLFVNCLIVNPAFTSQTKEQLTTKPSAFGSKFQVSDKFLNGICKTEVIANIMNFAEKKADQLMAKSDGSKRARMNNAKLTDANKAGTREGEKCILILTEGDSASGLALAGRAVISPDYIGVFPLRGKLLNVRDASVSQITQNEEIQNIKKFMGLQHKKEYTDKKGLRYGKLMIMTDQDHDGSHIKGLLINFFETQFPSLLKMNDFLSVFITPIVKVWKGDIKHPKQLQSFFTMPEYESWKSDHKHEKGWEHKYYKGLGTSSNEEAEVYFRDLDRHVKEFEPIKQEETELIDLAFSKKKADARKNWLRDFVPGTYLDMSQKGMNYDDFINKELILFSMADNIRSIPSVVDGLKPSQRKVLYTAFRRNMKKDIKVVELAGLVSGLTNYAYGDASLQQTIVALAQNFVGSNNINVLEPSGNFGSRRMGGNDAASARYIYTRLSPFARRIFHPADEPLLTYYEEEGKQIEPHNYVPIVPLLLLNGADGIGTGWSTSIPNYKPEDIVENLKLRMAGTSKEDMKPMSPWFRGFKGTVEDIGGERWRFTGIASQNGDTEVEITELPVRFWTQDFKNKLEEIIKAEKSPSWIKDYHEYNTPTTVHFVIKLDDKGAKNCAEKGVVEMFKLSKTMATSNLVAFDGQGRMHKYDTVLDMMEEFFHIRLKLYETRKKYMLSELNKELTKMSNQARFIEMVINGKLVVAKKKKAVLVQELKKLNFQPFPKVEDAAKAGEITEVVENEEDAEDESEVGSNDYDYLLGMAIWSLTYERIERLRRQIADKEGEIDVLTQKSPRDLWTADLDDFIAEWHAQLNEEQIRAKKIRSMGRRASSKLGIGASALGGKRKRKGGDDGSDSDFAVSKKKAAPKPKATSVLGSYFSAPAPKPTVVKQELKPKEEPTEANETSQSINAAGVTVDGIDEDDASLVVPVRQPKGLKLANPRATAAEVKPTKVAQKARKIIEEDDGDDDVFLDVAEEPEPAAHIARKPRAASKKLQSYNFNDDSDDSDGNDLLGDVSTLVKGIGAGIADNARALFSTTAARPGSSGGLKTTKDIKKPVELSDMDLDDTDYNKLVPQGSPQRPAPRNVNDTIMDEDSDMELLGLTAASKSSIPAVVKPVLNGAKKLIAKPVVKKAVTKVVPEPKKPAALSPAAKRYQEKQSKRAAGKSGAAAKTKKAISVDTDEEDLANDLLDGDSDEEPVVARATSSRPGRRAAVTNRKKYVESEDEDEEEQSFANDDNDDDDDGDDFDMDD